MNRNMGLGGTRLWLAAGVAMIAFGACGARAEDATELKKIVVKSDMVTDQDASGPVKGYVAKATEVGAKTNTPLTRVPQSVSVIGREEMDDRGITKKVDEALFYTPGVTAQPFGNDPDTDWIYIRGFDATQSGVFLDGLNLYSYSFGGFQIDPYFLERVSVLKGPASMLYGGSSPGGIVDMTRKTPTDEKLISTEAGINNFGNGYVGFDASDKIKDSPFSYRVTAKLEGGNYETDYGHDFRGGVMPQLTWQPDDSTKLNVFGYYSALDQRHNSGSFLPYYGTVKTAAFGKIDPTNFYGEPDIDKGQAHQTMLGYQFERELDNGLKLSQTVRYGHLKKYENSPYTYGCYDAVTYLTDCSASDLTDPQFYRIGFEHWTSSDSVAVDNRADAEFDTGPVNHNLMFGLDYKYYMIDQVQAASAATPISVLDPIYGVTQPANSVYLDQHLTQQQLGGYVQDQMRFGDGWVATVNGRYDLVHTDSDYNVGGTDYTADDHALTGRAALAYEFDNGVTPYLSTATFFNPQIGTTAAGNGLKPEEGYQYEAGVKYAPSFIDGVFTASVFQITKQNWTVSDSLGISSQIGEVRSRGVELEAKVNLTEQWKAIAGFSVTDLEITKHSNAAYIGNTPYTVPNSTASFWLDYKLPEGMMDGVSLGGGVRYQGKSWADLENLHRVPANVLVDAAIRYKKNDFTVSLNATNLFDKEYVSGCQTVYSCSYGSGRTVMLKVTKEW